MPVRYIRVDPTVNLFAPAVRAFGTIAIVGRVTTPAPAPPASASASASASAKKSAAAEAAAAVPPTPVAFTSPDKAEQTFPGELGKALTLVFRQSPGPTLVYGVPVDATAPDWKSALAVVAGLNVQLVVLANTPIDATSKTPEGPIGLLSDHVTSVSQTGADGMERMGVAMLPKGSTVPKVILSNERMVYIAHNSDEDAAVAVTGTIAGYEPFVSLLLKKVNIDSPPFNPTDIDALNGPAEVSGSGPTGAGVNWLTSPALIPGNGVYMGEGYTGDPGSPKKYIDVCRFVDHLSFLLKAQLIGSIGNVRISRSGLRALIAQMEAVLSPFVDAGVLNSFEIVVPVLVLLDKDPATLTPDEANRIHTAEVQRLVQVLAAVEYAGAVHRISIDLKFD
ncbi:hypothetical protein OG496_47045 [Streptomyces sp. NBC_00988]|uniref:hypothetical protein n=1 Tax=Streptomyces sp. NBC_00988 TaxID=2903704 RepID=UPI00386B04C6|nr:hypothetical protein OG496_47045 [Streptomyces sp. NBC_00988]